MGDCVTTVTLSAVLDFCPAGDEATSEVWRDNFGRFGMGGLVVGIMAIIVSPACLWRFDAGVGFKLCGPW